MQLIVHEMRTVGEIIAASNGCRSRRWPPSTGYAVGVAIGLALACDLVVASDRARFFQIFVKRGLALDGGTSWTLPRSVGLRRAKQIAFFGDMVEAQQALDWGLVNEVVPADELRRHRRAWGHRLASGPTTALSLIKRLLDASDRVSFGDVPRGRGPVPAHHLHDQGHDGGHQRLPRAPDPRFTGR